MNRDPFLNPRPDLKTGDLVYYAGRFLYLFKTGSSCRLYGKKEDIRGPYAVCTPGLRYLVLAPPGAVASPVYYYNGYADCPLPQVQYSAETLEYIEARFRELSPIKNEPPTAFDEPEDRL